MYTSTQDGHAWIIYSTCMQVSAAYLVLVGVCGQPGVVQYRLWIKRKTASKNKYHKCYFQDVQSTNEPLHSAHTRVHPLCKVRTNTLALRWVRTSRSTDGYLLEIQSRSAFYCVLLSKAVGSSRMRSATSLSPIFLSTLVLNPPQGVP